MDKTNRRTRKSGFKKGEVDLFDNPFYTKLLLVIFGNENINVNILREYELNNQTWYQKIKSHLLNKGIMEEVNEFYFNNGEQKKRKGRHRNRKVYRIKPDYWHFLFYQHIFRLIQDEVLSLKRYKYYTKNEKEGLVEKELDGVAELKNIIQKGEIKRRKVSTAKKNSKDKEKDKGYYDLRVRKLNEYKEAISEILYFSDFLETSIRFERRNYNVNITKQNRVKPEKENGGLDNYISYFFSKKNNSFDNKLVYFLKTYFDEMLLRGCSDGITFNDILRNILYSIGYYFDEDYLFKEKPYATPYPAPDSPEEVDYLSEQIHLEVCSGFSIFVEFCQIYWYVCVYKEQMKEHINSKEAGFFKEDINSILLAREVFSKLNKKLENPYIIENNPFQSVMAKINLFKTNKYLKSFA